MRNKLLDQTVLISSELMQAFLSPLTCNNEDFSSSNANKQQYNFRAGDVKPYGNLELEFNSSEIKSYLFLINPNLNTPFVTPTFVTPSPTFLPIKAAGV